MTSRRALCVPILALCALALAACLPGFVAAGGLDPLVPGQIRAELDRLKITTGGVYTPPEGGGGFANPATSDLDLAGYAITGGGNATFAGVTSATVSAQSVALMDASGTTLTAAQCRGQTYYADDGATIPVTLPTPELGLRVTFLVRGLSGSAFQVNAPDEIGINTPAVASAGYLLSKTTTASITLETCGAENKWITAAITGTWAHSSTTSAGYAYTPTAWTSWTPTSSTWTSGVTFTGLYRQVGDVIQSRIRAELTAGPPAASLTVNNWAGGFTPSATKAQTSTRFVRFFCGSATDESAGGSSAGIAEVIGSLYTPDSLIYFSYLGSSINAVTNAAPWSWADDDSIEVHASYAVD